MTVNDDAAPRSILLGYTARWYRDVLEALHHIVGGAWPCDFDVAGEMCFPVPLLYGEV